MKKQFCSARIVLFVIAVVLGFTFAVPAEAQFICVGNTTGTAVGNGIPAASADGAGAIVSGAGSGNFACGQIADAGGNSSFNTAIGTLANAFGDNSFLR